MKISIVEYNKFFLRYYYEKDFKGLRFGQAFYNHFNLTQKDFDNIYDDNDFYNSIDDRKVQKIIWKKFIA